LLAGFLADFETALSASVFYGFFVMSLVALAFREHDLIRRSYVVVLLCLLLATSLTAFEPIPLRDVHEYSSVSSEQRTHYEVRVVDAEGDELPYDPLAVPPAREATSLGIVGENMVAGPDARTTYTPSQRREVARYLLRSAREYRRRLKAGRRRPATALAFPAHYLRDYWTTDELRDYSRFVAIRVYRTEVTFSENGQRPVVLDEESVYTYRPGGNGMS